MQRSESPRQQPSAWAVVILLTLWPAAAAAHTVMTSPAPRDASDQHKDPNGPCGVARAASQPMTASPLAAGSDFTVTWTETVDHAGCFVVDFAAAGDIGWQTLATLPHSAANDTPRPYSTTVKLPNVSCTDCTLRVRQIMLNEEPAPGAACPPSEVLPGQTYYSCANVALAGGKDPPDAREGSCAYAAPGSAAQPLWVMLGVLAGVTALARRRR